jgi:uncharacterized phiE125 gp8 family phage protein
MGLTTVIAPTVDPLTVAEVKAHLRIDGNDEDQLLSTYIKAATAFVQNECGIQIMRATLKLTLDEFPSVDYIKLPRPPLVSVSSIDYLDGDGVSQTFSTTNVATDATPAVGRIVLKDGVDWPDTDDQLAAVSVTYLAGYADRSSLPADVRVLLLLLVGTFYEHRESVSLLNLREVPMAAQSLISHLAVKQLV